MRIPVKPIHKLLLLFFLISIYCFLLACTLIELDYILTMHYYLFDPEYTYTNYNAILSSIQNKKHMYLIIIPKTLYIFKNSYCNIV